MNQTQATITSHSKRLHCANKLLIKIDKLLEDIHAEFDSHDREVEPIINSLTKAHMALENLKISLERRRIE